MLLAIRYSVISSAPFIRAMTCTPCRTFLGSKTGPHRWVCTSAAAVAPASMGPAMAQHTIARSPSPHGGLLYATSVGFAGMLAPEPAPADERGARGVR